METIDLARIFHAQELPREETWRWARPVRVFLRKEARAGVLYSRCPDCYAPQKPVLVHGRRPTWAEFILVRRLRRAHWGAVWAKNWRDRRGALQLCADVGRLARPPRAVRMEFEAIHAAAGGLGGAWDVLAWQGGRFLFVESKQYPKSTDRLDDDEAKARWMEAAIARGHSPDSFVIVRYDAGPPLGVALPIVDVCPPPR